MPQTAAVILNYNDGKAAVKAAARIREYKNIDKIILVDNASTDTSRTLLEEFREDCLKAGDPEKIRLVFNDKNGGYGYGNNRGVDAAGKAGCEYALIANPDAEFSEKTVAKLAEALKEEGTAASGALMQGARYTDCAWPLLSFWGELAYAGPLTKRLFRREIGYPRAFFHMLPAPVGAVHGSLFMVNIRDFLEAGGFDEKVFLFGEEKILGKRLAWIGKKIILTDAVYRHSGSQSLKKGGMDALKRQKERQKSERYYYKNYLKAGFFRLLLARLQQLIVLAETAAAVKAGKI